MSPDDVQWPTTNAVAYSSCLPTDNHAATATRSAVSCITANMHEFAGLAPPDPRRGSGAVGAADNATPHRTPDPLLLGADARCRAWQGFQDRVDCADRRWAPQNYRYFGGAYKPLSYSIIACLQRLL